MKSNNDSDLKKAIVTGGAGFIGSYVTDALLEKYPSCEVIVIDKLSYAGSMLNLSNASKHKNFTFVRADICDFDKIQKYFDNVDVVFHLAAESHVDKSFSDSAVFFQTNILGTQNVITAALTNNAHSIIHVSTDEVYGPRDDDDEADELTNLNPTNPYSISKAAAEMIIWSLSKGHASPPIIVRPNNVYGSRQYPEKLIPTFITQAHGNTPPTVHGSGKQTRRYLAVKDLVDALLIILTDGSPGETYNIGTRDSYSVLEISNLVKQQFGHAGHNNVAYVEDRPFNDKNYATDCTKLFNLGWKEKRRLCDDFPGLVTKTIKYLRARGFITS
jgi:UDP-glucose 4,6-dehydratase